MQSELAHKHTPHMTTGKYWKIALYLAVITAAEVAVFYVEALAPVLAPVLILLSLSKFALVAMYFMHLRFDNPFLSALFTAGFVVAIAVALGILASQGISYIGPGT